MSTSLKVSNIYDWPLFIHTLEIVARQHQIWDKICPSTRSANPWLEDPGPGPASDVYPTVQEAPRTIGGKPIEEWDWNDRSDKAVGAVEAYKIGLILWKADLAMKMLERESLRRQHEAKRKRYETEQEARKAVIRWMENALDSSVASKIKMSQRSNPACFFDAIKSALFETPWLLDVAMERQYKDGMNKMLAMPFSIYARREWLSSWVTTMQLLKKCGYSRLQNSWMWILDFRLHAPPELHRFVVDMEMRTKDRIDKNEVEPFDVYREALEHLERIYDEQRNQEDQDIKRPKKRVKE